MRQIRALSDHLNLFDFLLLTLAAYRNLVSTRMLSLLGLSLGSISREHLKLHRLKEKRGEVLAISSNWLKQHLLSHIILKDHIF